MITGAVVADDGDRVLHLRQRDGYALAEAGPEDADDSLSEAALRLLAEEVGIQDVWTQRGPRRFLVDGTQPGQHRYGPRLRIGIRCPFWAHSGAVLPSVIETGAAAWVPLIEIGVPSVRNRVEQHVIGTR
ncbi:NUDIX hydrolase [Streptomyces sp. JL3001]|uniref:NUDIX hydrolase n=1 Tax=Streptomyces sp. JL3001 TaxID=3400923 RepID=UPI003B287EF3